LNGAEPTDGPPNGKDGKGTLGDTKAGRREATQLREGSGKKISQEGNQEYRGRNSHLGRARRFQGWEEYEGKEQQGW